MVDPLLNRREFIGATAVAGAGLLLNGCKSESEQAAAIHKSSLNTINIALIGYGEEGKVLLESLLNIEGVKLVALCDIWDYHLNEGARYLQKSAMRSAPTRITRTCSPRKRTCRR
jgi:hypothetical protein